MFARSVVFLFQHRIERGVVGVILAGASVIAIVFFAPWRFPQTPTGSSCFGCCHAALLPFASVPTAPPTTARGLRKG